MPRRRSYERLSPPLLHESRRRSVGGNDAERIAFTQRGDAELGSANLYRVRQHGLEHRLKFAGGTRDDSQHLRGRRLLLQCLAQIVGALTQLVEQTSVLDGDDSLVGKGADKRDLLVGEGTYLQPRQDNDANGSPLAQQRDAQHGAEASNFLPFGEGIFGIYCGIENVNRLACKQGAAGQRPPSCLAWGFLCNFTELTRKAKARDVLK